MCFAKGVASGFPFAGVAAKSHLLEGQPPGTLGGTYGAGPLGCAAANATIDAIEVEGMLENAAARGSQLVQASNHSQVQCLCLLPWHACLHR